METSINETWAQKHFFFAQPLVVKVSPLALRVDYRLKYSGPNEVMNRRFSTALNMNYNALGHSRNS